MYSKILIATDLSPASHAVVRCAAGLRSLGARECLLLQCLNLRHPSAPGVAQTKLTMEQSLAEEKALLEKGGLRVKAEVVPGFAQVEINRIAVKRRYSLVVVGSHGQTLLSEMLLGGVASAVIHHAVKPVLVIRVKREKDGIVVCAGDETCAFTRHVLFATDFSDNAAHAFRALRSIVTGGATAVTLCHVQDKARIHPHLMHRLEEFNKIDGERLAKMKETLAKVGATKIDISIRLGHPEQVIVEEIAKRKATLVVMGTQGRGFLGEACLGSVSHHIARYSPVPVLLIPAKC